MRGVPLEQQARAAEEASLWLERLERSITVEEGRQLRRWLKPALHREAIVERCKRWHGPEILAVLGEVVPVETFSERANRHFGRLMLAIAFGVTALSTITVIAFASRMLPHWDEHGNPMRADASFETARGEHRTIRLPDGGSILMNTSTALVLHYMPRSRDVLLLRGEARFEARSDPLRPFAVQVGARFFEIRKGEAAFNVYRLDDDKAELTVTGGSVHVGENRVWQPLLPALIRLRVEDGPHEFAAGEGGTIGPNWQIPRVMSAAELERRTAWQRGRIVFTDAASSR
jgi:transmembrane sensor